VAAPVLNSKRWGGHGGPPLQLRPLKI